MAVDRIEDALSALARGEIVVVVDDADRENEGDLIMAAEFATPERMAFFVRHTSGFICAAITNERADQLALPLMVDRNTESQRTAFTVTVDYRHGTSTGISAGDRALTARSLVSRFTTPEDLARPGHLHVLRARDGGVLERPGHTEAAVDLTRLAGLEPAGVLCEIVSEDRLGMARGDELARFAATHDLRLVTVADLVRYRKTNEVLVSCTAEARMPTEWGEFRCLTYESPVDDETHLALVMGQPADADVVLVRVHSECLTGEAFGSSRCDCGYQLRTAMQHIADAGVGVLVYLRGHEGRGIGIAHKMQAYQLQDGGLDTIEANLALGLPVDSREYGTGAKILLDLGVHTVRLMTNNPEKRAGLEAYGIEVAEQLPIQSRPNLENIRYLRTKKERMGHQLDYLEADGAG